ncbi:MAG: hypothetical protein AABW47_03040, partial [Nanoarchaeota archaeon]
IDWFTQTITDNGSGKSNWVELESYMSNLKREATEKGVAYRLILAKHANQLKHNLQTVWGGWIKKYANEMKEISQLENEIATRWSKVFEQLGADGYVQPDKTTRDEIDSFLGGIFSEEIRELKIKRMIHDSSTLPIYKMFCLPARVAVKAIEKKDWKGLEKSMEMAYNYDMTYI